MPDVQKALELAKKAGAAEFYPKHQQASADTYLVSAGFLERFYKLCQSPVETGCWACNDTGMVTTSSNGSGLINEKCQACSAPTSGNWVSADDVNRLVRELDVALNGKAGAAVQASLCDVVAQVRLESEKRGQPLLAPQADSAPSAAAEAVVYEQKENEIQVWFRPARMHGHPERTPIKATITKDRGNGIVDLIYDDGEFSGNARAVPNALRLTRNVREQVAVWWDVGFEMDFQTAVDNSLKKKKDGPPPQPSPTPQADSQPAKFTEIIQSWCDARCLPMPSPEDCQSLLLSLEAARKQGVNNGQE